MEELSMDVQLMTNYVFKLHFIGLITLFKELNLARGLDSVHTLQKFGLICLCSRNERKYVLIYIVHHLFCCPLFTFFFCVFVKEEDILQYYRTAPKAEASTKSIWKSNCPAGLF